MSGSSLDASQAGTGALEQSVRSLRWKSALRAGLLILPALAFVIIAFVVPIGYVLFRAIDAGAARQHFPQIQQALSGWNAGDALPAEAAPALVADLKALDLTVVADVARELNARTSGFRSLLLGTKRQIGDLGENITFEDLTTVDERWREQEYWRTLQAALRPFTAYYILAAMDLRQDAGGAIEFTPEDRRIYLTFIGRTFWICFVVTLACVLVGYPVAYVLARSKPGVEKALIFVLLIPFWTSVLVRTAAWVILLQPNGMVNGALRGLGLISEPLTLVYNRFGVYIAMVHVLLPFMILPIYSVMKAIPRNLMPAAASLGARPFAAFRQVLLPLSMPGVSAGCLMTFVLGLGYYVTPALVGGPLDQMESGLIARFALDQANWPMASAIAIVLLGMTAAAFLVLRRALRAGGIDMG